MKEKDSIKKFSVKARLSSANHAARGVGILFARTHNAWGHVFFALLALYLGYILHISHIEWLVILLAIGLVIVAEAFNTAIEVNVDLISPEYHPFARDTKDVAAGAVLLSITISVLIGGIIFLPKILPNYF